MIKRNALRYPHGRHAQDQQFIGQQQRFFHIVGDHEQGFVEILLEHEQQRLEAGAGNGIQGGQRFVQEDQFVLEHQGPHQGASLSHTTRDLVGTVPFETLQAEAVEEFQGIVPDVLTLSAGNLFREQCVVHQGQPWQEQVFLLHVGSRMTQVRQFFLQPFNQALILGHYSGQHIKQCAFPAPGRPDQHGKSVPGNIHAESVQNFESLKALI